MRSDVRTSYVAPTRDASSVVARGPSDATTYRFGSYHPGMCQFALCDGTVRPIPINIDGNTLGYLANKADNQTVNFP